MELTPNDIRNYEFQTQMRGYDKDEVDSLIKRLAEMFDQLKQDNLKYSMENDTLKSQLESLKELEETIKSATIDARKNANALLTSAKEEATKILEDAKAEATELLISKKEEHDTLERKIKQLEETRKSFVDNLQDLISSHLNQLDSPPPPSESSTYETSDESRSVKEMSHEMLDSLSESLEDNTDADNEPEKTEDSDEQEAETETAEYDESEELDEETEGLDPELASTADNYVHSSSENVEESVSPFDEAVETTKTAEEIPEGFIAQDSKYENTNDTIPLEERSKTVSSESEGDPMSAENLAATLDSVVAKFEEEMDKAEKN